MTFLSRMLRRETLTTWLSRVQQALGPDLEYYGDGGTWHQTNHIDVSLDSDGNVVEVWFRCRTLPFEVHRESYYPGNTIEPPPIDGIVFRKD